MSKLSSIKELLTEWGFWFSIVMLTLVIFLHVGLFKLAQLTAGISIFNEDDYTAVKWIAFVVYEATVGLGLTAFLVFVWSFVASES